MYPTGGTARCLGLELEKPCLEGLVVGSELLVGSDLGLEGTEVVVSP